MLYLPTEEGNRTVANLARSLVGHGHGPSCRGFYFLDARWRLVVVCPVAAFAPVFIPLDAKE